MKEYLLVYVFPWLRRRLVCPLCGAVGTWKPHQPSISMDGKSTRPWRWLCKWCGYYDGPEGKGRLCYPSATKGCWAFFTDPDATNDADWRTPMMMCARSKTTQAEISPEQFKEMLEKQMDIASVFPWRE
jgi:hypothetical protein